ncbi:MAG: hypothetical protein JXB06_12980 [Spirochaetales bacterium]|nr:hypothetical protein [Spirochaetales bacterium]
MDLKSGEHGFYREREKEMKVGRGSVRLVKKIFAECSSCGRTTLLGAAVLVVPVLSLVLSGCGDISLNRLLENHDPGELGITPQIATIGTSSTIEISGKGGVGPYSFSATEGTIEEIDGVTCYTAPSTETVDTITVVDTLAYEATATIQVESSLILNFPLALTVAVGESTGYIKASGESPYTFELIGDGTLEPKYDDPVNDRVKYTAPAYVTTAVIHVEDATGKATDLTITVVAASGG